MPTTIRRITATIFCALLGAIASPPLALSQGDPNPAMNHPDQFAWQTFVAINRSANNGSNDAIWERWAEQTDVYADPNKAPTWPGATHQPKVLHPSVQRDLHDELTAERRENHLNALRARGVSGDRLLPQFIPTNPTQEEARMNKATFDFIVGRELWYVEGQIAAFNKGERIDFPPDSIEVKAHWKEIPPADQPRYHWQKGSDGKIYGLIALHIMTKDVPNWFWATFEHVDNPERCKVGGCHDAFGVVPPDSDNGQVSPALVAMFKAAGMGDEWQSYRLTGSQVDFTDSTGVPTLLGNSEIEGPLGIMPTSSCITCHAKASVDGQGFRLNPFSDDDQSDNGPVDPNWFWNMSASPRTMKYLQLDFIWSLSLARSRTH